MNTTPIILGLDGSSTQIGWVIYDGQVRASGTITLRADDIAERCRLAYAHVGGIIGAHPDLDVVAIESPVARFAKAVIPQARVSGAVLARVALFRLMVVEVTPAAAKQALAGRGNADKAMMRAAALVYGLGGDEHQADALGVALSAAGRVEMVEEAA